MYSILSVQYTEKTFNTTVTYSSVVAAWNAYQKDAGSNFLSFFLFLFISTHMRPLNAATMKKGLHLSLLVYLYLLVYAVYYTKHKIPEFVLKMWGGIK